MLPEPQLFRRSIKIPQEPVQKSIPAQRLQDESQVLLPIARRIQQKGFEKPDLRGNPTAERIQTQKRRTLQVDLQVQIPQLGLRQLPKTKRPSRKIRNFLAMEILMGQKSGKAKEDGNAEGELGAVLFDGRFPPVG